MASFSGVPCVAALSFATMLSFAAVGSGPAIAQTEPLPPSPLLAQNAAIDFNIPAQPLGTALTAFGRQTGIQVLVDSASVSGKTSTAVSGAMTAPQALQQLLGGTGVPHRFSSPTAVTVGSGGPAGSGALQLDPVQVQGVFPVPSQAMIDNLPPAYAGGQVATGGQLGLLGNRDVMSTPFNQTSYTAKKVQDQQAKTVREALIDDPSVRASTPSGSLAFENVYIRGFTSGSDQVTYGGLYGMAPTFSAMPEFAERVEVLKGPSAMLNGMPSSMGGTINLVPKRAPDAGLTQLTASYLSSAQFGAHADVARRFGEDKQFGVRFNGVFRAGQTDVQWNSDQRALASLGLDYRGERVRLSADFGYQYQYVGGLTPYLGVANGIPIPWAPNVRNNPGAQPWNFKEIADTFGVVRGEVDITEQVTAYAAFGMHDVRYRDMLGTSSLIVNNINGNANAGSYASRTYNTYLTAEAGLRALVDTGPVNHAMAFTATTYATENGYGDAGGPAYATNLYNPNIIARPNIISQWPNKASSAGYQSLGFADTLSGADKRIQLTVGARLQQVTSANYNLVSGVKTSEYNQSALSPSVALVLKPLHNVSVYGNWIQGLRQGTIVGTNYTNAGEILPPFKTNQYEAGIKVDWGRFTTTASLFQITQPSLITNVAANTLTLAGEQRNQGLELNFFGEVTEGVRVLGGAMFLNAVLAKTQGGLTNGWTAPFSPSTQINVSGEWDLPWLPGFTLNGRMVYTSAQYIDTTTPRRMLADWVRFDLGARYAFDNPAATGKRLVARFNVENVADANYWAGGGGATTLFLGAPRTFRLALTADF